MRSRWKPHRRGQEQAPADDGDAALVAASQQGDKDAFARLYDRYQDLVLRFCYYRLGDWDEAGDATQEIFVDVLAGMSRFRDRDGSFRTWLMRIAHNHVVDLYRRRSRRTDIAFEAATDVATSGPSPEALAISADEGRRVRAALTSLPDGERAVLELRLVELTGPEIAQVPAISHDAVRKAQSRAVARLRTQLVASVDHEGGAR